MFTGIVQQSCLLVRVDIDGSVGRLSVDLGPDLSENIDIGASIAVDGVCLTATSQSGTVVDFDVIMGTLQRTIVPSYRSGQRVNVERSMVQGDEIGGHELSGHVDCTAEVISLDPFNGNTVLTLSLDPAWTKYIFAHGFVAVNGVSLTVSDFDKGTGKFSIWLIPETLRRTNLGNLKAGERVNIEIHRGVQVLVDTIESALERIVAKALSGGSVSAEDMSELLSRTTKLFSV